MQLNDLTGNVFDQDKGAWFEAADPLTGAPTGLRFRLAGPDSTVQAKARLALVDELSELADLEGHVSAENRDRVRVNQLARCILDWEVGEDGQPLRLTHANAVRLLRAGVWLQAQIDARASDRRPFPIEVA
jgi:hypothetical protein